MKTTVAVMAIFTSVAIANNCTPGLNYCGSTLLSVGNYAAQISQALSDSGVTESNGGKDDLFSCVGGTEGDINYISSCSNGCVNAGSGKNDVCDS